MTDWRGSSAYQQSLDARGSGTQYVVHVTEAEWPPRQPILPRIKAALGCLEVLEQLGADAVLAVISDDGLTEARERLWLLLRKLDSESEARMDRVWPGEPEAEV